MTLESGRLSLTVLTGLFKGLGLSLIHLLCLLLISTVGRVRVGYTELIPKKKGACPPSWKASTLSRQCLLLGETPHSRGHVSHWLVQLPSCPSRGNSLV